MIIFIGMFAGALAGPSAARAHSERKEKERKRKHGAGDAAVVGLAAIGVTEEMIDHGNDLPF